MVRSRNNNNKKYFTKITEIAIIAYNNCESHSLRNKIYNRFIHYPFDKIAENVIHTYKTYCFDIPYEDVKAEVVAELNQKISRYESDKGKAFSYFTVIARNFLWNENNSNYNRMKNRDSIDKIDMERDVNGEHWNNEYNEIYTEFFNSYIEYVENNLFELFDNHRDQSIADSVIVLFKDRNNLYSYNKKALYILIRERTGVKTQYITRVVSKLKNIYSELYDSYTKNGYVFLE